MVSSGFFFWNEIVLFENRVAKSFNIENWKSLENRRFQMIAEKYVDRR